MASYLKRCQQRHNSIKRFYLAKGRTEEQWQVVNNNPALFNQVWKAMLRIRPDGKPPEPEKRL